MRFSRFLTMMLCMSLVGLITACGTSSQSVSEGASSTSPVVQKAIKATTERTGLQTQWIGPTSGSIIDKNKTIVYIPCSSGTGVCVNWGNYLKKVSNEVGWKLVTINNQGSAQDWVNAFNQAISLHPSGIVSSANAQSVEPELQEAATQGIPVVGIHFTALPGPDPQDHVYYNIESNPTDIGKAQADYVIAKSKGNAKVIILYDSTYGIARAKAASAKKELLTDNTIKLLDEVNSPLTEISSQMPQLISSWVSKYGPNFWVISITDDYYDNAIPTLVQGGVPKTVQLVGSDGTASAYNRIKNDNFQVGTVPEPVELQAFQAVDELNRAFHQQEPNNFSQPAYIVDKNNINIQGGTNGEYKPDNNYAQHYLKIWGVSQ